MANGSAWPLLTADYWTKAKQSIFLLLHADMSPSHIKIGTSRIPYSIKETVSIIDSKLLGTASKSHLPYLSLRRLCSLINNTGMNEQGDKSDTLLSWGQGAELRVCISILPHSLPC